LKDLLIKKYRKALRRARPAYNLMITIIVSSYEVATLIKYPTKIAPRAEEIHPKAK